MIPARSAPESFFEWYDRAGRPTLRMAGVFIVLAIGLAFAAAFWRTALSGVPMPDMTGGLMPLALALAPNMIELITRHREVMRGGGRAREEQGPLVNSQALA